MIDGKTQLVGLLAWPVGHSLSPVMHNAAFDALGLNWRYLPLPAPPGQVEAAVRGLAALGFCGANVTVPHKQAVIPALDAIAPDAAEFGAVNTIVVARSAEGVATLIGHNTDYKAFINTLRQGEFDPTGKRVVVVGAGGAGRAVVFGLLREGVEEIVVLDIAAERAEALLADLGGGEPCRLRTLPLATEALIESARAADLLVNATPLGMWPHVEGCLWPDEAPVPAHLTVFDLVYNPLETRLLRQARASGARGLDGLGMLVGQGALAFGMWTGAGPLEKIAAVMRRACEQALA